MSAGSFEGQGLEQQQDNSQGQQPENTGDGTGINPAWNDLLETLPSSLHSQVTPHLQQWDKNYQEGIGKVHSQYEPYKPYLENNVPPEQLNYGLQLLDILENQPEQLYEALAEQFGNQQQQEEEYSQGLEEQQGQESQIDFTQHPQWQQLEEMVNLIARNEVQRTEEQQNQQQDAELEQEFNSAKEKHGDFDENWVMVQLLSGNYNSVDEAAAGYKEFVNGLLAEQNRPTGPKVLGPGGSAANSQVNPAELGDKDRRNLVAQMLANAHQQNG